MATYTQADRSRNITRTWELITSLEAEYNRKRASGGRGWAQQTEARKLINRIDRLRREAQQLAK